MFGGFGHINGLQLFNFGQDMDNPVALLITTVIWNNPWQNWEEIVSKFLRYFLSANVSCFIPFPISLQRIWLYQGRYAE